MGFLHRPFDLLTKTSWGIARYCSDSCRSSLYCSCRFLLYYIAVRFCCCVGFLLVGCRLRHCLISSVCISTARNKQHKSQKQGTMRSRAVKEGSCCQVLLWPDAAVLLLLLLGDGRLTYFWTNKPCIGWRK